MTNKLERHRREVTALRIAHGEPDPRPTKRYVNHMYDQVNVAYDLGSAAAYDRAMAKRGNPYPPGRRHDEWQRGFDLSDPMGDHMGRNE